MRRNIDCKHGFLCNPVLNDLVGKLWACYLVKSNDIRSLLNSWFHSKTCKWENVLSSLNRRKRLWWISECADINYKEKTLARSGCPFHASGRTPCEVVETPAAVWTIKKRFSVITDSLHWEQKEKDKLKRIFLKHLCCNQMLDVSKSLPCNRIRKLAVIHLFEPLETI